MAPLVWLITGCSSGFGEELTKSALSRGDKVIATGRGSTDRLKHLQDLGAATLELDVCRPQATLDSKIQDALAIYGDIDVLVNNAGYIEAGLLEDISAEQLLSCMNTNIFGAINLTRSLMPTLRAKSAGTIVWNGSCGGWQGEVSAGPYCASKFAMEGVVECFQKETVYFGIKHILFEPGFFKTKVHTKGNIKFEPLRIDAYSELYSEIDESLAAIDGNQPGDPSKAAERIVDVVRNEGMAFGREIPLRLPLGADSMGQVRNKCLETLKIIEEWESFICSTDYDK